MGLFYNVVLSEWNGTMTQTSVTVHLSIVVTTMFFIIIINFFVFVLPSVLFNVGETKLLLKFVKTKTQIQ